MTSCKSVVGSNIAEQLPLVQHDVKVGEQALAVLSPMCISGAVKTDLFIYLSSHCSHRGWCLTPRWGPSIQICAVIAAPVFFASMLPVLHRRTSGNSRVCSAVQSGNGRNASERRCTGNC